MSFTDPTPVRLDVELTKGELAALIDDPIMLREFGPAALYATAKQSAIRKLAAAREATA